MSNGSLYRLLMIAEDVAAIAGGVPAVVKQLSGLTSRAGIETVVLTANGEPQDIEAGVDLHVVPPSRIGKPWSYSRGLLDELSNITERSSKTVMHVHGVWSAPQFYAASKAKKHSIPFVFSAHGMLEPWLWNDQGWKVRLKKRTYWKTVCGGPLKEAAVVHAITPIERDNLRELFPNSRIEVIPNAMVIPAVRPDSVDREKVILFLGRVDPKKGVALLLHAFAASSLKKDWKVLVAGPVWSEAYFKTLKELVQQYGLEERFQFLGPVFGDEKQALMKRAWVMAVPSFSEVVGLVNLEAGVNMLPTITTHQTGLFDWEDGGGVLIEPNVEALQSVLEEVCAWSDSERSDRGNASYDLVVKRYSWDAIYPRWSELYSSLALR